MNSMEHHALKHPEEFLIVEANEVLSYGCQQRFYSSHWKRLSGCGPTAASNLILYHQIREAGLSPIRVESARQLMNAMWAFITPGMGGVNTTQKFVKGLKRYITQYTLPFTVSVLDVSKKVELRPSLSELKTFIFNALDQNSAIAFLNLHKGETKNLDEWHWVTIIEASYDESLDQLNILILDDGKKLEVDCGLWLKTTQNKGGFVVCN